jgi:uncharacterized protein YggE
MNEERRRTVPPLNALLAAGLVLGVLFAVWLLPARSVATGLSAPLSSATAAPVGDQARITVKGTGIVSARPDTLYAQVGVQSDNGSLADAQWDASQKIAAMLGILKDAGVEDKDIATSRYAVDPLMEYPPNQQPRRIGYRVTHILSLKIRDITNAGKLIDQLAGAGANNVANIGFGFSDPNALLKQARDAAMGDAWGKGQQYARLSGVTLGLPLLIEDAGANTAPARQGPDPQGFFAPGASNTLISPGQLDVRVEVNVVYAIR